LGLESWRKVGDGCEETPFVEEAGEEEDEDGAEKEWEGMGVEGEGGGEEGVPALGL